MLANVLSQQGWTEFIPVEVVAFDEVNLAMESSDREVWRTAQKHQLVLVTANRRMVGDDSLEQVLREENTVESLPVLTLSNADKFKNDSAYRDRCVDRIVDILLDLENLLGSKRLFVP